MFPKIKSLCNHSFIFSLLKENSIVIDLGANRGEFSNSISKEIKCKIYASEPIPELYAQVAVGGGIQKFPYCIFRKNGPVSLIIPDDLCASLYHPNEIRRDVTIVVEGVIYSSFMKEIGVDSVDLLKVDIEGAEIDLFNSMPLADLQAHKQITIEFHDFLFPEFKVRIHQIKEKIIDSGFYQISFSLDNSDVLFVRKDVLSKWGYLYLKYFLKYYRKRNKILPRIRYKIAELVKFS